MPRRSELLLPTEKLPPADAEAVSHQLMVRAGLVRQIGSGLWTWLPAGWRTQQRIMQIIREEIDAIGGQEMLMPVLQPVELWDKTGRSEIDELFKLRDRKESPLVLAMTHEEAVTSHVAQIVGSYRDLPLILYHFQVKERDEPRPRAGVLRTREFTMKDSYSFDRDFDGLELNYAKHIEAYDKIFDRTGLEWYRVASDVGMMGGTGAHEYMAPCAAGEDEVALATGYAANVEIASATAQPVVLGPVDDQIKSVSTPGLTRIEDVASALELPKGALLKAFPVIAATRGPVLVVLRGDHTVAEIKLTTALGGEFRPMHAHEVEELIGPPGYTGPAGSKVPVLLDLAVADTAGSGTYVAGANAIDAHLTGVLPGRDFDFESADIRQVVAGDTVDGQEIRLETTIEAANIFKLGTRYSEALGAYYSDENGKEQPVVMGSYGIGPARIAAAAVEQFADEAGISWPAAIAPYDIQLVSLAREPGEEQELADRLYDELSQLGLSVLYDDRESVGPGAKFADAELLGLPIRVTIGRKSLERGELELQQRRGRVDSAIPVEGAAAAIAAALQTAP